MYTGGGPKHRTFLCVKTAIITLQNFLILITYLEFEHKWKNCSGLSDVRKLLHEIPEKNLKLLDESCKPCTQLIKDQFSCLQLKWVQFWVPEEAWRYWWAIQMLKTWQISNTLWLAAPWPTLGYYWGGSLTHLVLITAF